MGATAGAQAEELVPDGPGEAGDHAEAHAAGPSQVFSLERLRPNALTWTRAQPGSGRGAGRSRTVSASGGAGVGLRAPILLRSTTRLGVGAASNLA